MDNSQLQTFSNFAVSEDGQHEENENYPEIWHRVQSRLKDRYGEATFKSWMQSLHLSRVSGSEVLLVVPTRFIKEWILNHYIDEIRNFWQEEAGGVYNVDVIIGSVSSTTASGTVKEDSKQVVDFATKDSDEVSSPLDRRFTFDNFVVGPSNALAHAALKAIADAKQLVPGNNPLFIHGGVGLGKTHLLHSLAWHIRKNNPSRKVVYLSAEKFMYKFILALRNKDVMSFKKQFRSLDVLLIDDIQFISGKGSTQEEFFHTFNTLMGQNSQLVIAADRAPSQLIGIDDRIKSRLGGGLVADISTTNYELRLGILQSKLKQMKVNISDSVLDFLAAKITSNIRELEGALNKVVAHSTLVGREITLETTQDILHDLLCANDRVITIEEIQKSVSSHYNIRIGDLVSNRRTRNIARPRQIAMYLAKQFTPRSLSDIGRKFGGKDHTTVMHAVRKVETLCMSDREFAQDVEALSKCVQQSE